MESSSLLILIVHLEPIGFYLFIYLGLLPPPLPHQAGIYNSVLRWPRGRTEGQEAWREGGRVCTLDPEKGGCRLARLAPWGAPGLTLQLAGCWDRSKCRSARKTGSHRALARLEGAEGGWLVVGRPLVVPVACRARRSASSLALRQSPAAQRLEIQGVASSRLSRGEEEKPGTPLRAS